MHGMAGSMVPKKGLGEREAGSLEKTRNLQNKHKESQAPKQDGQGQKTMKSPDHPSCWKSCYQSSNNNRP
jgi:hypothetical protein